MKNIKIKNNVWDCLSSVKGFFGLERLKLLANDRKRGK